MSVAPTKASKELEQGQEVSPHKLISLLMQGVLERVDQARESIKDGNENDQAELVVKIVQLIEALRDSLNFDAGGEIAVNLGDLYQYMIDRVNDVEAPQQRTEVLNEIEKLIGQVKDGWDQIDAGAAA